MGVAVDGVRRLPANEVTQALASYARRSSFPPGSAPSRRSPKSTRVRVVALTIANVRRGVSSETYVFRACTATSPAERAARTSRSYCASTSSAALAVNKPGYPKRSKRSSIYA